METKKQTSRKIRKGVLRALAILMVIGRVFSSVSVSAAPIGSALESMNVIDNDSRTSLNSFSTY